MLKGNWFMFIAAAVLGLSVGLVGCGGGESGNGDGDGTGPAPESTLSGKIDIDGSSTVYPITQAVAEAFTEAHPDVNVQVGVSGTGGGMKRFTVGETAISNASRPIKPKEHAKAKENGVEFIEVPVAYDGLSIVINKSNDWATEMTVDDLKKIFLASSAAEKWSDVNPDWPDIEIEIYAPGTDSGTFDYFKEVVIDEAQFRPDAQVSEDDNVIVRGVTGSQGGIGFFGSAYYFENQDELTAVKIKNDAGEFVAPTPETIESGEYNPFSRPLFIYVNKAKLAEPQVDAFVDFYFDVGGEMAEQVGYVKLPKKFTDLAKERVEEGITGTSFSKDGEKLHGSLSSLYTNP